MPKVTIIVPVYNSEQYLAHCLNTIKNQTFTDWECILVDDGSQDTSGKICDAYQSNDSRFIVIHKKNGGVSNARQSGLNAATGEYIVHADPDDWLELDMLEKMYSHAVKTNADMVICDYYAESTKGRSYYKQQPSKLNYTSVLKDLFTHLHGSCWNKLVKRDCINQYKIKFPNGFCLCEDLFFNAELLRHPINVSYLPLAFYHYDLSQNQNSMVRRPSVKAVDSLRLFTIHFKDIWENMDLDGAYMRFLSWTIRTAYYSNNFSSKKIWALFPNAQAIFRKNAFETWYSKPENLYTYLSIKRLHLLGYMYLFIISRCKSLFNRQ